MKSLLIFPTVLFAVVAITSATSQDGGVIVVDVPDSDDAFPNNPKGFVIDEAFYMSPDLNAVDKTHDVNVVDNDDGIDQDFYRPSDPSGIDDSAGLYVPDYPKYDDPMLRGGA
ncbi:uncharacterized protein LOC112058034 isoform X1 [Bicyclus anynana]|uniref:Uncharacterized protein LOC112058034 isoform X1 n=1 Tax=Bicyclus anynana TaxID=110368 RepID=A0ABM3LXJ3_BICAN|nr:uncharacterized protein LOC112058034 isoform X1 [Bicyclus anynana]